MADCSTSSKLNRRWLIIGASLCAIASAVLFVFRPIPPIGLVAAIDLAGATICILYSLIFPRHVERMQQHVERTLEKEPRTNVGQWVP